ncbi:MAG: hypothetical protein ABW186_13270 [Rhodanobacteraceae bacterium]
MANATPPRDSRKQRAHWIGVATALMTALAGGAIWCLVALYARHDLIALSLPIAGVIVWALRANGFAGRWSGALLAAVCVALACAYSLYLQATAQVASLLGLPLRAALTQMEPRMALDIAWAGTDAASLAVIGVAILVAAIGTLWVPSRAG